MSDYLKDFLTSDGVITRSVKLRGKEVNVHFRRISAGQKSELLKGQKVQAESGKTSTFEIDLGENAQSKALLVFFSVVDEDGKPYFKRREDAQKIDAGALEALYAVASDINSEEFTSEDLGKS